MEYGSALFKEATTKSIFYLRERDEEKYSYKDIVDPEITAAILLCAYNFTISSLFFLNKRLR